MRYARPARDCFRDELQHSIVTIQALVNEAHGKGRDCRDLLTVIAHLHAALRTVDYYGPVEAEAVVVPADPRAAASAIVTAVLTATGAMQEAIAATELVTLKIEAVALRPELVKLVERLRGVDVALRVVVAAMIKTNVLAAAPVPR